MCKWGDDTLVLVPIPADLSHTGEARRDWKGVDTCIAPIVMALNDAGIRTSQSCCGHGKTDGSISLWDGREIIIRAPVVDRELAVDRSRCSPKAFAGKDLALRKSSEPQGS